jgi:uncharacterized protein YmfQ (DUF2313 family)
VHSHADLLKQLLPPVAYDRTGLALSAELTAHGAQLDAFQDLVPALLQEMDPRTTEAMLPDWERVYGLPDPCSPTGTSLDERRAALVRKVAEVGGMTRAYFENLAAVLGYRDTSITTYRPTTCEAPCDAPVRDVNWRLLWSVNLPHEGDNHAFFRVDSVCTESVDRYQIGPLECMFIKRRPAHTLVLFTYNPTDPE